MSTYSREDVAAFDLFARLQGIDPSQLATDTETLEEPAGIDYDIEFEDEPKKKTRGSKSKGSGKSRSTKPKAEPRPAVRYTVPELEEYAKLNRGIQIEVTQKSHDIKYKEQSWGIPVRHIKYNIEIINQIKVAKDMSDKFNAKSEEERQKAEQGLVRYFKIVSYENIPYRSREIGYIKVEFKNGKMEMKTLLAKTAMKENNIDPDKVAKTIKSIRSQLLGAQ